MSSPAHPTEFQIESARVELDADAEGCRSALAAIQAAEAIVEAVSLGAHRHSTSVAADDAGALLSLAADEMRAALALLGQIEVPDLVAEIADAASAALAERSAVA